MNWSCVCLFGSRRKGKKNLSAELEEETGQGQALLEEGERQKQFSAMVEQRADRNKMVNICCKVKDWKF